MDFNKRSVFLLLLLISAFLYSVSEAEATGSVFFVDNHARQYLRTPSVGHAVQSGSISIPEIGAAISVLLGFAPPANLSAASSSKLNEVLRPNPFDRPRAVFMLEVTGVEGSALPVIADAASMFSVPFKSETVVGSDKAQIELPGEEVSVVALDGVLIDCTDEDISDFASWLGGSYVPDASLQLSGVLTIPSAGGHSLSLHMSKEAEREFVVSLLKLYYDVRRAIDLHEDLSQGTLRTAELMMSSFEGIKALQEESVSKGVLQQGVEILFGSLSKILESLQEAYKGKIVGVMLFNGTPPSESENALNVKLNSWQPVRWLEETKGSTNATAAEVALVRTTLAWLTGIILIIATLLGIHFLLNMPLTRDTLLYSSVKLD